MFYEPQYQYLWIIYGISGISILFLVGYAIWSWRFLYLRFWILLALAVVIFMPWKVYIDQTSQYFAPALSVWLISNFFE